MLVLARDEANPQAPIVQRRVIETFVTHPTQLLHLTVEIDGGTTETLVGTPNHPFYSFRHGGFVEAGELAVGDTLSLSDGKSATVTAVRDETALPGQTFTTYNFAVAEHHTYFVGESGIWVHNTGNLCEALTDKFLDLKKNPDLTNEQLFKKLELEAPDLANGNFGEAQIQQHLKDVKNKLKTDYDIDIDAANNDAQNSRRRAIAPDNYRGRFNADRHARGLPRLPDDYDAHHRIPQEYMDHPGFQNYDFHQPSNIQGVKGSRADVNTHQLITNEWAEFRRLHPNATRSQIEAFAAQIDVRYARHWFK